MREFADLGAMFVLIVAGVASLRLLHRLTTGGSSSLLLEDPYLGGERPSEHALSRFHARWYAVTLLFLAFDVEMLFMYPWAVVVARAGASAVTEMFIFLGLLMCGVLYAWREGVLEWA
jgi:NADH-quinone oxidoreductase subunit A